MAKKSKFSAENDTRKRLQVRLRTTRQIMKNAGSKSQWIMIDCMRNQEAIMAFLLSNTRKR